MSLNKRKHGLLQKVKITILWIFVPYFFSFLILLFILPLFNRTSFISPLSQKPISEPNKKIEEFLSQQKIQFSNVSVASDSSYLIILKDGGEVDLSSKKDLKNQISSLQLILSRLTIEGKRFKKLDLRFDKPIVIF